MIFVQVKVQNLFIMCPGPNGGIYKPLIWHFIDILLKYTPPRGTFRAIREPVDNWTPMDPAGDQ
jgi:hypothetical protein